MMRWRIDTRQLDHLRLSFGLLLPAVAGLAFFGLRVLGVWGLIISGALVARLVLKRFRTWRDPPTISSLIIDALLLGMFFPATLYDPRLESLGIPPDAQWPALLGMGVLLAVLAWAASAQRQFRFHPVALAVALLALASSPLCQSDRVLTPRHLFGDVLDERAEPRSTASAEPWLASSPDPKSRVFVVAPALQRLSDYLGGVPLAGAANETMSRLVSDDLPPLEDLVIGGHPRRIGCASAIALLIGGLFLIYRGYVAWRVPVLALAAIYLTLAVLPAPVVVGPESIQRVWLPLHDPRVGIALGLTFVNYVLAVSPLLLVTIFLATQPSVRPARPKPACLFAVVFGVIAAALTLLVSVTYGAIVALLITQALFGLRSRPSPVPPAAV